jgi:hypothetical protein
VHGRQVAIEDDHVVVGAGRVVQGSCAVVHHVDGEPCITQALADPVGQRDVVFHDEHSHVPIVHQRR